MVVVAAAAVAGVVDPFFESSTLFALLLLPFFGLMLLSFSLKKPFMSGERVGDRLLPRLESTLRFLSTAYVSNISGDWKTIQWFHLNSLDSRY